MPLRFQPRRSLGYCFTVRQKGDSLANACCSVVDSTWRRILRGISLALLYCNLTKLLKYNPFIFPKQRDRPVKLRTCTYLSYEQSSEASARPHPCSSHLPVSNDQSFVSHLTNCNEPLLLVWNVHVIVSPSVMMKRTAAVNAPTGPLGAK